MKPHSLETDYVSFRASLQARVDRLSAEWPHFSGFWSRWCHEHQLIARQLSGAEIAAVQQETDSSRWSEFLTRRQRMVSTLSQGLRAETKANPELREELKDLLREHDLGFVTLLQKELEQVKEQMTHAFTVRKTVKAYAQTAQFRGE